MSRGRALVRTAVVCLAFVAGAAAPPNVSALRGDPDYALAADGTRVRTRYDLDRRFYVGVFGGFGGERDAEAASAAGPRVDFGLRLAYLTDTTMWRVVHELGAGAWSPGGVPLGHLRVSAYKGTFTRHSDNPGITVGSRHVSIPLYVGFDVEGLRLDVAPSALGWFADWDLVRSSVFLDLWHSRDMRSYLRVSGGFRFGVAFPRADTSSVAPFFGPTAGLEARWQGRLQAATFTTSFSRRIAGELGWKTDLRATAEYEVVLFAVNERPASAVLQLSYGYDDRFAPGTREGVLHALAGLRFSLGGRPR